MSKVKVSPTPNPNSLKFSAEEGRFIEAGMASYRSAEEAEADVLGRDLFDLAGVANVFITPGFVTVTKSPDRSWRELERPVLDVLEGALAR